MAKQGILERIEDKLDQLLKGAPDQDLEAKGQDPEQGELDLEDDDDDLDLDDDEDEPVRPRRRKKAAAKKGGRKKAAAKKGGRRKGARAKKNEMADVDFKVAIRAFLADNKPGGKSYIDKARKEMFDPDIKVVNIPAEDRQDFLDRIEALSEEDL